tara:strand:+ start:335 stop:1489 length:1155 start_codon:yes stop_codon:yes gene_type:complete
MGLFGLSNKELSFLGGVAGGIQKTVDREMAYTDDSIKDTSGIVIKARLDSKARRTERINEFRQDISELVSLGYGKQEAAAIVKQNRKNDFAEIAKTTPKDQLNTVFKVSNAYDGDTPLSIGDLAQAVAGRYEPPNIDLSNLPKRKTFLSAIGIDDDITEKIKNRVATLTPKDKESEVDFDKLAGLLSGETTPFGREKLRKETGSLSATSVESKLRTYITEKLGGTVSYISGQPVYKLDQREDRMTSTVLTADFLDRWRDLTKGDNAISKEKAYKQLIGEIDKDSSIAPFKEKDGGDGKDKVIIDPNNIIKKKNNEIPVKPVIKNNPEIIREIAKKNFTSENSIKYNSLAATDKAIYKRDLIKRFVDEGGMTRVDAENAVKQYFN